MIKNKILILGAGGFIGSHLCHELALKNHKVLAAGRHLKELRNTTKDIVKINNSIIDESFFYKIEQAPSHIFFLLGSASVNKSIASPISDFEQSLPPLLSLLEIMRKEWNKSHLIFVSSAAVYGENAKNGTSCYSDLKPISPYGLNKKISEEYIQYYSNKYNISSKIVRPFSVYGPGLKKQLIWDTLTKIKNNDHNYYGTGDELRDWVYISDLINILIKYVDCYESMPNTLNIGSGIPTPIKDIIKIIYEITETNITPNFLEREKEGDPLHLVSTYTEQKNIHEHLLTPIYEGLEKTINWYNKLEDI